MKKYSLGLSIALLLTFAIPALVSAQDAQAVPGMPPPSPVSGSDDQPAPQPGPGTVPAAIKDRLQSEYQAGMDNLQNNRDYRNTMMQHPGSASTTPDMHPGMMMPPPGARFASTSPWRAGGPEGDMASSTMFRPRPLPPGLIPPLMKRFASSTTLASSTLIERVTADHQDEQGIRADAFAFLQNNLIQQLNQAISNLQQIRGRIAERIQTETAQGVDMTKATGLLATADADIAAARAAIQALAAYAPSTPGLTASTTVDLEQGRQLGGTAIASVDAVRKDLDQTVQAIAAAMGVSPAGTSTEMTPPPPQSSNQ